VTRIRIENVVASASLGVELDLQSIAFTLDDAEYEPDRFPGLIYRLKQPKTAILLFHSGKAVCTGGKSWKQVDDTIRTVSELIRRGGQKILRHPKIQVQNIVATSNLESEINLNSVAITLGLDRVEYEPEQFPGLVCRLEEPRVVVLLFGSGKLVCTGARRPSDVILAVEKISKELRDAGLLRREPGPTNPAPNRSSRSSRSSTGVSATPSPNPTPPSEASATPTAFAALSSPDSLRAFSPGSLGSLAGSRGPSRWGDRGTGQGSGRQVCPLVPVFRESSITTDPHPRPAPRSGVDHDGPNCNPRIGMRK
jgi:transcription initiation factor TFIID TATA-box-binding protein